MNASVGVDARLWREDIDGSLAHSEMLAAQGVISETDRDAIHGGLNAVAARIEAGTFEWSIGLEDVHMNIESRLTEAIGLAGGRLHTARSRNDQVATDVRLWLVRRIDALVDALRALQTAFVDLAERLRRQVEHDETADVMEQSAEVSLLEVEPHRRVPGQRPRHRSDLEGMGPQSPLPVIARHEDAND